MPSQNSDPEADFGCYLSLEPADGQKLGLAATVATSGHLKNSDCTRVRLVNGLGDFSIQNKYELRASFGTYILYRFYFACVSLTADDGPQRARLHFSPTATLTSCLWSRRIFPSLPGSRVMKFYRDSSSALLQLVNRWLNFTFSRSHAFHYRS